MEERRECWEKALAKDGWKMPKREWEDGYFGSPFEIQHKYVTPHFDALR
jgi:hypothetical protein